LDTNEKWYTFASKSWYTFGLKKTVGAGRLAAACRLALSYGRYSFLEIQDILKTKSELIELPEETPDIPEHENIRGKEYYK
jgi:hypothetical protein